MKNLLVLILLFVGFVTQAQIANDQYTIITKKSADWCTNCGGWAWPVFEDIQEDLKDKKAITLLMHHTGGLSNPAAAAITDNLGGVYQPEFFLNNDIQNIGPSNAEDKRMEIVEQVDLLSSLPAFAGIAIDAVIGDADNLLIKADVEFFDTQNGEFYLGLYLVQTNILHNQANQGVVIQPRLLTDHITNEIFGDAISGSQGVQTLNYDYALPNTWAPGEIEVVAILWLKDASGVYRVFNANMDDEIEFVLSNDDLEDVVTNYSARINQGVLSIDLESTNQIKNANILLSTIDGKRVMQMQEGNLQQGMNYLNYDTPTISTGLYIVTMEIDGRQISQRVVAK